MQIKRNYKNLPDMDKLGEVESDEFYSTLFNNIVMLKRKKNGYKE